MPNGFDRNAIGNRPRRVIGDFSGGHRSDLGEKGHKTDMQARQMHDRKSLIRIVPGSAVPVMLTALMLVCPLQLAIFSPGDRASGAMMRTVQKFLRKVKTGGGGTAWDRVVKKNKEQLFLAASSVKDMKVTVDETNQTDFAPNRRDAQPETGITAASESM